VEWVYLVFTVIKSAVIGGISFRTAFRVPTKSELNPLLHSVLNKERLL